MRRMPNERQRLLAITIVAGGACGLAAVAFHISVAWLVRSLLINRATSAPGMLDLVDDPDAGAWAAWSRAWDSRTGFRRRQAAAFLR